MARTDAGGADCAARISLSPIFEYTGAPKNIHLRSTYSCSSAHALNALDNLTTIAHALAWATHDLRATSETPRLDAELLLAHVLGWGRARLLAEGRLSLTEAQAV